MIYAISALSIASLVGFLWALRSTLLERMRIENELLEAMTNVHQSASVDIDVAVNDVNAALLELVQRMGKIESVVQLQAPEQEEHKVANPYLIPSNLLRHGRSLRSMELEEFQPLRSEALIH